MLLRGVSPLIEAQKSRAYPTLGLQLKRPRARAFPFHPVTVSGRPSLRRRDCYMSDADVGLVEKLKRKLEVDFKHARARARAPRDEVTSSFRGGVGEILRSTFF